MKKKLEADLISIAHRILKLKNKSEVIQLHQETQKLYEKLSVLRFLEENFAEVKPTIGQAEIEEKLNSAFEGNESAITGTAAITNKMEDAPENIEEEKVETTPEILEEEIAEEIKETVPEEAEDTEEMVSQEAERTVEEEMDLEETAIVDEHEISEDIEEPIAELEANNDVEPHFELFKEEPAFEVKEPKREIKQISFEDLLGGSHSEPIFERVQKTEKKEEQAIVDEIEPEVFTKVENHQEDDEVIQSKETFFEREEFRDEPKPVRTNNDIKRPITFGLNDKIAFEKQLFGGSSEDLNRVVSQLSTFDSFDEAQIFIDEMVKPDYHNWEGKDDYAQRFMEIVERRFS
ncbi:hypothetical protein [Flavobacterium sp. GT3R68]|uniref:hypothetical protein n=1 Tax=Flavobacterium sp. GT3R68 TaxID=2594437 RepID=UPI000F86CBA7|nr:hypothetical protein [Flavobacterium sp. GT3R68]RTY93900.1 hypothetical protein EKL32_13525 [Flavobacterium sp. GSN2]TRW93485.1 hypothetical protein FNW07_00860 [Flavobacterium sp. GT3R68]